VHAFENSLPSSQLVQSAGGGDAVVSRSEDDDKLKFVHSILAAVMSHTMSTLMPMQWHDLRLTGRRRTVDM